MPSDELYNYGLWVKVFHTHGRDSFRQWWSLGRCNCCHCGTLCFQLLSWAEGYVRSAAVESGELRCSTSLLGLHSVSGVSWEARSSYVCTTYHWSPKEDVTEIRTNRKPWADIVGYRWLYESLFFVRAITCRWRSRLSRMLFAIHICTCLDVRTNDIES